ncbi:MAG: choice-of-anchor J domain-containing protein [Bacteroidales bacterium]
MRNFYLLFAMMFVAVSAFGQARIDTRQQIKDDGDKAIYLKNITYERGVIEDCPANSLGSQPYSNPSTAGTSEVSTGYATATEFTTVGGTIETVHLWMASMYNDGSDWSECTPDDPYTVNVYFMENNGGVPGDTLHSFTDVTGTVVDAGVQLFDAYTAYFLSVDLGSSVDMQNGFLLVEGTTASDCWLMWIDTGDGNGTAFQYDGTEWGASDQPFTYCLEGTPPACASPSNLDLINITDVSMTLSWDQLGTPDSWDIEVVESGVAPTGTPTETGIIDNPYTITGLTAATTYDVYIRSNCGGGTYSEWAGPVTEMTSNCDPADQCAYTVDMVDEYGDGWNGGALQFVEDGVVVGEATLDAGETGTASIDICDAGSVDVIFVAGDWPAEIGFTISDPYGIELYTAAIADFAAEDDGTTVFSFTGDCTAPSCPAPEDLTATAGLNSADLGWTETGTADTWNIEWGPTGFTQGGGTLEEGVMDNPYTLSGLDAATMYDFYVQADCGGDGTSLWAGPYTFTTECEVISSYPFHEGFETAVPPACWLALDEDADGFNWMQIDYHVNNGSGAAMSASWDQTDGALTPDNYLISPQFDINQANLELGFYAAAVDPDWTEEKFSVMISTSGTEVTDFTEVHTETIPAGDSTFNQVIVPLSDYDGELIYIAIRHWDVTDMFQLAIDDFEIDAAVGENMNATENIAVFPNPADNMIYVENAENAQINVMNMVGQVVASKLADSNRVSISIADLAEGTYIIRIENGNEVSTQKLNVIR